MLLKFDPTGEPRELKTPILVYLFRGIGILILLGSTLAVVASLMSPQSIDFLPSALLVGCLGVLASLVPFGFAEVILLIAKIELNTSERKDAAILQVLYRIERQLEAAREPKENP